MKYIGFLIFLSFAFILVGCNAGTNGSINVSAQVLSGTNGTLINEVNGNSCTNMVTGSTCTMQLTLNNNGTSDLNLSFAQVPATTGGSTELPMAFTNNAQFANDVADCQSQINDSNNVQIQCNVTITYQNNNPGAANNTAANLVFYIGNAYNSPSASGTVFISGD